MLDELLDLSLYKALCSVTQPDVPHTLNELIKVETAHLAVDVSDGIGWAANRIWRTEV